MYLKFGASSNATQQEGCKILKMLGFTWGNSDPFLYIKKKKKSIAWITFYGYHKLFIENSEAIDEIVALLQKKRLHLKDKV